MFKIAIVLSMLLAVSFARVRQCTQGTLGPFPEAVRISGCDVNATSRCRIIRGTDIKGEFDFVASECKNIKNQLKMRK